MKTSCVTAALNLGILQINCSRKDSCKKRDCKGCHATLLHPPETSTSTDSSSLSSATNISASSQRVAVSNGYVDTSSAENRSSLSIVPVKVCLKKFEQSIVTQAFLSAGSTSLFITCDLTDKLQTRKAPIVEVITVTMTLIKNKKTQKAKVISNLKISELSESSYLFH